MYVEGLFVENRFTLEGTYAHEHADFSGHETRGGTRSVRAMPLFSEKFGLAGKADIVEFIPSSDGIEIPFPVDYKRGQRKKWENDDIQLCAQALCLEEMFGCSVDNGAIYHVKSKRRREVSFNEELRKMTLETIENVRGLFVLKKPPCAILSPRCNGCSLESLCLPELEQSKVSLAVKSLFCIKDTKKEVE